jgi:hypothetical protein
MKKAAIIMLLYVFLAGCNNTGKNDAADASDYPESMDSKEQNGNIIDSTTTAENFDPKLEAAVKMYGNFTNSGNREALVLYEYKSDQFIEGERNYSVFDAYVFTLDGKSEEITNEYALESYGTTLFAEYHNINNGPMSKLGREISWQGQTMGYVGDFNQNGLDEIYLYILTGWSFYPWFFEFDGKNFRRILSFVEDTNSLIVVEVDEENRGIKFSGFDEQGEYFVVYQWSDKEKVYVRIGTDR